MGHVFPFFFMYFYVLVFIDCTNYSDLFRQGDSVNSSKSIAFFLFMPMSVWLCRNPFPSRSKTNLPVVQTVFV